MDKYTINSFRKEFENSVAQGDDTQVNFTLTGYEQSDSTITISLEYTSWESLEVMLSFMDNEKFYTNEDGFFYAVDEKGYFTFSVDINDIVIDDESICFYDSNINIIEGKIHSVELCDKEYLLEEGLSEKDIQEKNSKILELYKNNSKDVFESIAQLCQLTFIK